MALFLSKEYKIERSIDVNVPVEKVFPLVSDFSLWNTWSPWYAREPKAIYKVVGEPQKVGSVFQWEGKAIGVGQMELVDVQTNQSLSIKLDIQKPQKMKTSTTFNFETVPTGTRITWVDQGTLSYPLGRLFKRYIENMLGHDFEFGLSKLKEKLRFYNAMYYKKAIKILI